MRGPDRRHAVGVARRTVSELAGDGFAADGFAADGQGGSDGGARGSAGGGGSGGGLGGDGVERAVVAAALLHDVGKVEVGYGPVRRALATVVGLAAGHDRVREWHGRRGPLGRAGTYLCHDAIGAELLRSTGSDELTIRWAREHHLPPDRWTVPPVVGAALKSADDD